MIKRLAIILLFIPVLFLECVFILYEIIKWLFTGEEISDYSLLMDLLDW